MARILIASDDWTVVNWLQAILEADGHEVVHVTDGIDAYARALSAAPDLVLMTDQLTGYGCEELCRMLRADPDLPPTLPALVLAGPDTDERTLREAGASGFVPRACSHSDLRELLVKHLGVKAA